MSIRTECNVNDSTLNMTTVRCGATQSNKERIVAVDGWTMNRQVTINNR